MAEKGELSNTVDEQNTFGLSSLSMHFAQLRRRYLALPDTQQKWLIVSAVSIVVLGLVLTWLFERPDWRPLFSGLEQKDIQQVSQELAAAGIPFQATSDGSSIEVPSNLLDKARMEVATKGMPQTGRLGFELFDKPNWVGSEFDEHVNYQRALEGELEHTIASLESVRAARVHLVLPEPSLFTAEAKPAKASVVLKLRRPSITPAESESIRNLVAGAVSGLAPNDVVLIDADGRINLMAPSPSAAASQRVRAH